MSANGGRDDHGQPHRAGRTRLESAEGSSLGGFADKWLGRAEWGLAAALALAVGSLTYRGICSVIRCSDAGFGLPPLFLAALAGIVALGIYLTLVHDRRTRWPGRIAVSAAAVLLIVMLLVVPVHRSGQAALVQQAAQRTERVLVEDARQKAEEQWRADLLARGQHGPPGLVPPALQTEQSEAGVVITNTTKEPLTVALARVREDATAPGGWRACSMHTAGSGGGNMRFYHYSLGPAARTTFVVNPSCAEAFRDAPIEYRVGRSPGDTGWWSDSAFTAPKREFADGS
jgi:hypothetical protein